MRIWDVTVYYEEEAPGAYTISTSVQPAEGGAVSVKSSANEGDDVAFEVAPAVNYELDLESVQVTDANDATVTCSYNDQDGKYHFTMPASNVTISANFSQAGTLYILGQVNGREASQWNPTQGTPMTYQSGKYTARVYVTGLGNENQGNEKEGYGFLAFSKELAPSNNQAGWDAINNHGLRYGSGATGDYWPVSANEANQSHFGDVIPLYQHSQKSYRLPAGVYDIEIDLNTHPNSVKFTPVDLTLTLNPASGTFNINKQVAITSNLSTLIASINPDETRVAISHKVGDGDYQSGATATLGTAGENITVTGRAALGYIEVTGTGTYTIENKYTIAISTDNHGTVTAKVGDQTVTSAAPGETVALSYNPQSDYQLAEVTVTDDAGNPVTVSDNTFTMPASNVAVAVTFSRIPHGITVSSECVSCTITDYPATATAGTQVSFTVRPKSSRYSITSVTATNSNGSTINVGTPTDNGDGTYTYTFGMQAYDVVLCAVCERQSSSNTFKLVTSQADIRAGGEYVILNANGNAAMAKSTGSTPNYDTPSSEFDLNGETVTLTAGSNVSIFTLADGTTQGKFKIKEGSSYVQAPTSSGNSPTLGTTQSDWTVNYNNGSFTVATTASTVLTLRYNSSHFRVYTSATQGSGLKLYKRVPTTAEVTIDPESGNVIGSQEVVVDATTETAVVRYKVDNGEWSAWTAGPVNFTLTGNVDDTKVVTAQAKEPNQELEEGEEEEIDEASATYTFVRPAAPAIAPESCSVVDVKQSVSITSSYSTTYPGTVIEYSTDGGTTWTTYTGEFDVLLESFGSQATVQARVTVNGVTSDVVSATYTRNIQPVQFSPVSGTYYYGEQSVEMFSVTRGARIYYTMTDDGSEPADPVMNAQGTSLYSAPITDLQPGKTYRFKAVAYIGTTSSEVTSATYIIEAAQGSGYWPNIAAMNAEEDEYAKKKLENPVQVVYMSTYKNNGYKPEYAYIRDNSGYGLVYFGNAGVTGYNSSTKFQMGDWLAGGSVEGYVSVWSDGFHNELGDRNETVTKWPSTAVANTPIIPETVTNAQVKAGWDDEAYNGSSYATGVTESNLWGHYVHLHNNTLAGVADRSSSDDKHKGVMTDPTGTTLTYYDVFYKFSGHNGAPHYDQSFFDVRQQRGATFDFYGIVAFYGPDITSTTYSQQPFQIVPLDILWVYKPTIHGVEAGHTYTGPQTVSLTLDAVDGDDEHHSVIWYKTSEMDDYAIYTGPFEVSTTTTIEAYTTKMTQYNDQMESNHVTMQVTFTTINPPVISPESAVYATTADPVDATIMRDASDGLTATVWFTVDGSDPSVATSQRYEYTEANVAAYLTGIHTTTTVRAIAEVDGVYSAEAEPQTYSFVKSNGVVYELVTDVNQLTENGVYMIVSKNYGEALSTTQNTANRGAAGVMFVEGSNKTKVYGNSDVALFQLSHLTHSDDQSGDNHFLFHTGNGANDAANGYLCVGHETDNTLLTEPEEDDLGNDVVLVTIDSDGRAHLQMNYSGGSNRYIQYWNRDRYFTSYKTEDTDRAVYIYYTAATPLAVIEQSGKQGESYTVADDLQVVYACQANGKYTMWARDLVDNINAVEVPATGGDCVDYMHAAGQQTGQWQQNNWVMLDFASVSTTKYNSIADLLAQGKHPVVKGGTLSGQFVDQRNYTIKVSNESSLELDTDVDNYVFNVYCPANYGPNDENGSQQSETQTYWFMTPKVMEVATHTWSVWKASGDDGAFYMPERKFEDGKWFNEANLQGAYDVAWDYNAGSFQPTDGEAYQFLAVTMLKSEQQSEPDGAPRRVGAQPDSQPNATQVVNPLDLNGDDEHVVTAVNRLVADRQVVSVTYCDVAGRMSTKPFKGVNIVVTRYSDGTQQTTKTTIF